MCGYRGNCVKALREIVKECLLAVSYVELLLVDHFIVLNSDPYPVIEIIAPPLSERVCVFREERIRYDAFIHYKCGGEVSGDSIAPNCGVFRTCTSSCWRSECESCTIAAGGGNLLDSFQSDGCRITIPGEIPGISHLSKACGPLVSD